MTPRSFALLGAVLASGILIACSSPLSDGTSSSDAAITGSLAGARACAIRDAYAAASLDQISSLTPEQIAATTKIPKYDSPIASGVFDVRGVGMVYVIETSVELDFFTADGTYLAASRPAKDPTVLRDAWYGSTGEPLLCAGDAPSSSSNSSSSSGSIWNDDRTGESCLSLEPIDATKYRYVPPRPASAGACSTAEAQALASYYAEYGHSAGWRTSVSTTCTSCVFGTWDAPSSAPIVDTAAGNIAVSHGACVQQVSGSEACGRAYEQFSQCAVDACLVDCRTQSQFAACRRDERVLTTSCKTARETLKAACGDNLGAYETKCNGTTYGFEGPVRVACVTGPS